MITETMTRSHRISEKARIETSYPILIQDISVIDNKILKQVQDDLVI